MKMLDTDLYEDVIQDSILNLVDASICNATQSSVLELVWFSVRISARNLILRSDWDLIWISVLNLVEDDKTYENA